MSTGAAALWAGALWIGCLRALPPVAAVIGLVLLGGAATLAAREHRCGALSVSLIALLLVGAGLAGGRELLAQQSPLVGLGAAGTVIAVAGRVVSEPRVHPYGSWALVRVSRLDDMQVATRALLQIDGDSAIAVGQPVAAEMRVTSVPAGSFGRYLRGMGAVATLQPLTPLQTKPAPAPLAVTTTVRQRASRTFAAALPPTPAALLGGLSLGTRDGIPMTELEAAGLSHLVVVSGGHVAVLLVVVLGVATVCGVGLRGRCRLALTAVWWFVLLTRWEPTVLRAAVMITLVLIGMRHGRAADTGYTLAMAVILLLLVDPLLSRQAGFALSVLATGGILYALRERRDRGRITGALVATVAAQTATAPVILWLAGEVPLAAVPANVVAGPAAVVAQTVGLLSATLAAFGLPGGVAVARLAAPPLDVLWWSASAFTALPALDLGDSVLLAVLIGVLVVVGVAHRLVVGAALLALGAILLLGALPPSAPRHLRLTVLDVGQGDGLLVEAPDGHDGARMVVDGGPDPLTVASELRARRIAALDALVLTHGHDDHSGGLAAVLRRVRVAVLLLPDGVNLRGESWAPSAREAVAVARARRVPIVRLHAGMRFALGAATVEVLAPSTEMLSDDDPNATSVVLRIAGPYGRILLTGDSEAPAQQRLLARPDLLRADVLKVPHHGGATNAPGFLDAVQAQVAVATVGVENRYGHPAPETLADLAPVPLWRTDRHGTIAISLTPAGPVVDARP